jgi:hypothetical protein
MALFLAILYNYQLLTVARPPFPKFLFSLYSSISNG